MSPARSQPASASIAADYARRDMVVDSHVYTTADLDTLIPGGVRLGDRFTDGTIVLSGESREEIGQLPSAMKCCMRSIAKARVGVT